MQIKVGIITYDFYPPQGGQGVEAYELYKKLMKSNNVVPYVFSPTNNDLENHICIPSLKNDFLGLISFSLKINFFLKRLINQYSLDVIHFHGGVAAVFMFKRFDIPLICLVNQTYIQQYHYFKKPIYKVLMRCEKITYDNSDKIISISTTTKKSLINDYNIPSQKISVIPVGVNTKVFRPIDLKKIPNSVLYVGRLHKRKGLVYLIDAISLVRKEISNIKLYIIGEGDLKNELELIVQKENLSNNITSLGKVSETELIKWYNKAEVFVLPSLFEGFGIVCIEAMACGTPVIGTRVPGIVDIIRDGESGILVLSKNSKELGRVILKLLKDEKLRETFGQEGRKQVLKKFTWDIVSQDIVDIYKEVIL